MPGNNRLDKNDYFNEDNERIIYPSTSFMNKKPKKKKKTETKGHVVEDLKLEDINDDGDGDYNNEHSSSKSKKKTTTKTSSKKTVQNAFYN